MNTHDIERLIDRIEASPAMDIAGRSKHIHDLRVAIEADRKRRGGPVKPHELEIDLRTHASMARWQAHSLSRLHDAVATSGAAKVETLSAAIANLERMAVRLEDSADYVRDFTQPTEQVIPSEITADKLSAEQSAWHAGWEASRDALPRITDADIQRIMLKHGYTIKPGHNDLKPYVYAAARELIALAQGREP